MYNLNSVVNLNDFVFTITLLSIYCFLMVEPWFKSTRADYMLFTLLEKKYILKIENYFFRDKMLSGFSQTKNLRAFFVSNLDVYTKA